MASNQFTISLLVLPFYFSLCTTPSELKFKGQLFTIFFIKFITASSSFPHAQKTDDIKITTSISDNNKWNKLFIKCQPAEFYLIDISMYTSMNSKCYSLEVLSKYQTIYRMSWFHFHHVFWKVKLSLLVCRPFCFSRSLKVICQFVTWPANCSQKFICWPLVYLKTYSLKLNDNRRL